jgi:SAM-dependent methyltransferase
MSTIRIDPAASVPPRPTTLAALSWRLYSDAPPVQRWVMAHRPYICPIERLIEQVPVGATVLDVGCGAGLFLGLLAATGRQPHGWGFDSSGGAIQAALAMRGRVEELAISADLHFERRDASATWPEGWFDVVSVIDVMHHVPPAHHRAVFQSAHDAVKPGGLLIYKDIGPRPAWRAFANRLHDLIMAQQWIRYRAAPDVLGWAHELGLSPLLSERINRLWYGHDLLVFRRPEPETAPAANVPHGRSRGTREAARETR